MKILVTGGAGFLGINMIRYLLEAGHEVVSLDIAEFDYPEKARSEVTVIQGSILDSGDLVRAMTDIDVVIHLASRAHVMRESLIHPLEEYRRINVGGTACLAKACVKGAVGRMIFLSSIGVNGESTLNKPFTEGDAPSPMTPYALSKLEAEHALVEIAGASDLEYTIIRAPLVYGPNVPGNFYRLLNAVNRGFPLPLSKIDNVRSFVGVGNLADFIKLCILHQNAANQLFLVSDGEDVSTTELIRCIYECMGKTPRLFYLPHRLVKASLNLVGRKDMTGKLYSSLQVETGKARSLLGWHSSTSMRHELLRMTRWYLKAQC